MTKIGINKFLIMKYTYGIFIMAIIVGCSSIPTKETNQVDKTPKKTFVYPIDAFKFQFNGRHVIVNAIINDSVMISLLFDTGAQTPLFDSAFTSSNKEKLGITFKKTKRRTVTPGGVININSQMQGELKFSALGMDKEIKGRFDIADLSKTRLNTDALFPAYWFFENNIVLMDFEHQYFRILSQDTLDNIKNQYTVFPFKGNQVTYFTVPSDVEISTGSNNIKLKGELVLDIGAPGFLYLQAGKRALKDNKSPVIPVILPKDLKVIKTTSLSWNPRKTIQRKIINTSKISLLDTFTFHNEQVNILDFRITPNQIGFLGNEFFRKFQVIFDYKNNLFYLKPNQEYTKPHNPFSLGMKLYRISGSNSLYVNSLYEYSPAIKAGIKLGDIILKINDKPTDEITNDELRSLEYSNPGTKLTFEVQRDKKLLNYEFLIDSLMFGIN